MFGSVVTELMLLIRTEEVPTAFILALKYSMTWMTENLRRCAMFSLNWEGIEA